MDSDPNEIADSYELNALDRRIVQLLAQYPDITNADIAREVNLTPQTVVKRRRKPAMQAALADLTKTTEAHLREAAQLAARRLKALVLLAEPSEAEPFIKMALANHINSSKVQVDLAQSVHYKTTVQADGTLLRQIVEEELGESAQQLLPQKEDEKTTDCANEETGE